MSIEAMKQALEALTIQSDRVTEIGTQRKAITSLRQAIAELESQEPVAWMREDGQRVTTASDRHNYPDYETRYSIPLYTHPPQRTWVGLTDEDMSEIEQKAGITEDDDGYIVSQIFKLTDAKLKQKNGYVKENT